MIKLSDKYCLPIYVFFFHKGPNYIRPNQSYLYSNKRLHKRMKQEQNNMINVILPFLIRVHHMPMRSPTIKEFTQQMEIYMQQRCMAPLSYRDIY